MIHYTTPAGTTYSIFETALSRPHILIAGCTGSGKSTVIKGLMSSILYRFPDEEEGSARLILVDPKRVELAAYKNVPHTICHAAGYNPEAWAGAFRRAVEIMDKRYAAMERRGEKLFSGGDVYVVIDEWAAIQECKDKEARECRRYLLRLVNEGRAARVHVIMATQVPNAKIIPTEMRENFDCRFALRTQNAVESRVVMGESGCELLPRYGKCYFVDGPDIVKYNVPFVTDEEIDRLVAHCEGQMRNKGKRAPGTPAKNRPFSFFDAINAVRT